MDLAVGSFPDLLLRAVRRSHVELLIKGMTNRGLAAGTTHTRVQNVRAVLRAAVANNLIAKDPSAGFALPRRRRREASMSIPPPEILGRLLDASQHAPLIAVCAFAGLRLGDAAALKPEDLEVAARTVAGRRQVQGGPASTVEIKAPKAGSERAVFIPERLVTPLENHLDSTARTEWMFADDGQLRTRQNTVGHWCPSACKTVGVFYRLDDLRLFYASGVIAAGCDVVTVQRVLGHARDTPTLDTYSHLWPTAEDRTRKAAGERLSDFLRTVRGLHAV